MLKIHSHKKIKLEALILFLIWIRQVSDTVILKVLTIDKGNPYEDFNFYSNGPSYTRGGSTSKYSYKFLYPCSGTLYLCSAYSP